MPADTSAAMQLVVLAMVIGVVVAVAWVVAPRYLRALRAELDRSAELEEFARERGLAYERLDLTYPSTVAARFPFELFSRGLDQRCENLLRGTDGRCEVVAFDFWYSVAASEETPRTRGGVLTAAAGRAVVGRSCAVATFAADCPHLAITREGTVTRALADAGVRDIELESADFNAVFHVAASDRKFASDFLDPRMMQWLLDTGRGWDWEIQRGYILCSGPLLRAPRVAGMLDALAGVQERIPRAVFALYGSAA